MINHGYRPYHKPDRNEVKNDIMDRYFRGEFIDRQAIKDAIAAITNTIRSLEAHGQMEEVHALNFAIQIIDKYTGVRE